MYAKVRVQNCVAVCACIFCCDGERRVFLFVAKSAAAHPHLRSLAPDTRSAYEGRLTLVWRSPSLFLLLLNIGCIDLWS